LRRAALSVPEVIRNREKSTHYFTVVCRQRAQPLARKRSIAGWAVMLPFPLEPGIVDSNVRDEVQSCLALARSTQTAVASGERLAGARAAVELVKAYDRVLENIQLVPLSLPEQQRVRDQLTPVTELLRKYRLR